MLTSDNENNKDDEASVNIFKTDDYLLCPVSISMLCKSIIMPDPDQDTTIAMIMIMMIFSLTDRMTVSRNFRTITTFYSHHPTFFNYLVMMKRSCMMTSEEMFNTEEDYFTGMHNAHKS